MTSANNPYNYLYNVSPLLKACGSGGNANCTCTDPSVGYTTPCSLKSASTTGHSHSSRCYFGSPGNGGVVNSTGGSLVAAASKSGAELVFKVKPNNSTTQPFTSKGSPNSPIQGAATQYPRSLLFCANPGGSVSTTGTYSSADPTPSTNNIQYAGNNFTGWGNVGTKPSQQSNLGFDTN